MRGERFSLPVAVHGVLVRDGRVLLMRRAGSGYRDGQLGLPADTVDYVVRALEAFDAGEPFVAFGWAPKPGLR